VQEDKKNRHRTELDGGIERCANVWACHVRQNNQYLPLFSWQYIAKQLDLKLKVLKSSSFETFNSQHSKKLRRITRFL
jgi:hypothetical protein